MTKPHRVRICADIWVSLQESKTVLTVFYIQAHKALTPLGNQEPEALAQGEPTLLVLQ